jgi:hypothetical protein
MAVRIKLTVVQPEEDANPRDMKEYDFMTIARVELSKGEVNF